MAQNPEIPNDADKMLFAEDFMSFMMRHMDQGDYLCSYEPYRGRVHNAFNESLQNATRYLDAERGRFPIVSSVYRERINELTPDKYTNFITDMNSYYFPEDFVVHSFLVYCVRVTTMAVYFFMCGVTVAPNLAVQSIYNVLLDKDMARGGWDALNLVAAYYAERYAREYY